MSTTVRAALLQTDWAGSQEAMIDKHEEAAREAATEGAQVMCFQTSQHREAVMRFLDKQPLAFNWPPNKENRNEH